MPKTRAGKGVRVTISFSDSMDLVHHEIQWSPKGVRLLTKWPFQEGREVEFAFDHQGTKHCCVGIVVACHPLRHPLGYFETILFFVETPCSELQKAACACRLAREHHHSGGTQFTTHNQAVNGVSHDGAKKASLGDRSRHVRANGTKAD